jgi:ADP-ribose pyrophosphatase YjhB (NUDIX family)
MIGAEGIMTEIQLAAAIVVHKNHVLVVRRSETEKLAPGVWAVPCGKLDNGEKPTDAVLRELHEETGLTGIILEPADYTMFWSEWKGSRTRNRQWNYLVRPDVDPDDDDMPEVTLPKTDQKSKWVPTDQIDTIAGMDEHNRATIRQGLAALRLNQARSRAMIDSSWRR